MKLISVEVLLKTAANTFLRFPLTIISAVLMTGLTMYQIEENLDSDFILKIISIAVLGLSLFLAVDLYAERNLNFLTQKQQLRLAALAFLVIYFFTLPEKLHFVNYLRYGIWLLVFHLLVSFAPYLFRKEYNGFWQYNQTLFIRLLIGGLYSTVLYLGISVAILAIDQLFSANINYKIYGHLWILIVGIFNTLFFLGGVPDDFELLEQDNFYPIGLKIFTQYVLLPLVSIYLIILYSYSLKIIFQWSLPKGWVSNLVIAFSIAGIFSLLLIHPIKEEEENKWIKIFGKWFYRALLPLILLLFVAISKRIWDYGITELRYYVIIIAFWLAGISLYFLFSQTKNIKDIPISLAIVAFLSTFGPWGAFYISEQSQIRRMASIFEQNKLLVNGKFANNAKNIKIKKDEIDEINSILDYLNERESLAALQPFFRQNLDSLFEDIKEGYEKKKRLIALMNIPSIKNQIVSDYGNFYYFNSEQKFPVEEISNFNYRIPLNGINSNANEIKLKANEQKGFVVQYLADNMQIVLSDEKSKERILTFDLKKTTQNLQNNHKKDSYNIPSQEMTLLEESARFKAKLWLSNLTVQVNDNKDVMIDTLTGIIWLEIKK